MLDLGIIEKHVLSFKENYPDTKEPKQPIEPQKPKKPDFGSSDLEVKRYERAMKDYPKRHKGWEKRVAKWSKETHPSWQAQEDRLKNLRQLQIKENGTLYGGSGFRAIRITELENELETEYYLGGDGKKFPDFERIFNRVEAAQRVTTITNVTDFKKFVETVVKSTKVAKVEIEGTAMTFKGVYNQTIEEVFESATWTLDQPIEEPIKFGINPKFLADMLKLFKQLKIKEFKMYVTSPILPIVFIAGEITYIITPIRTN